MRFLWLIILSCLLLSISSLWSQDSLVIFNNTLYPAAMFNRTGGGIFISSGTLINKSYDNKIDSYLTQYYDHYYVNPENSSNTINFRHSISSTWSTLDIGFEIPVYKKTTIVPSFSMYTISYTLIEDHSGYWLWGVHYNRTVRNKVRDRILIPALGLKYYLVDIPGIAVFANSDIGYPIAKPSTNGFEAVAFERFDYKANGLKLGVTTGFEFGTRGFSVSGKLGYIYLPMKYDNYYLRSKENFGGFKLDLSLITHF